MPPTRVRFGTLLLSLGIGLGIAYPASAATQYLQAASLQIQLGSLAPIQAQWDGTGSADVDFLGGSNLQVMSGLSAGILGFQETLDTPLDWFPFEHLLLSGATGAGGTFLSLDTAGGGGQMAILGGATLCPSSCDNGFTVPLSDGSNGWGVGGVPIVSVGDELQPVILTIQGSSWTTGSVAVGNGSASGTPAFGGTVTLVTALNFQWRTKEVDATVFDVPGYASMTLTFVPEPGTVLLVSAGLAVLGAHQRRRIPR